MSQNKTIHRLPALLEAAAQRLKLTARAAVERTIESLGLAALAAGNVFQRDALLGAQFELNRKSAMFALAFGESLDDRLRQDCAPRSRFGQATNWGDLGLVDDSEVERKITAGRFGLELSHACEWELRELEAYLSSLLGETQERNPLRPEVVGMALIKGIEAVSERDDVRTTLRSELGRVLALEMRATYAAIVADLRKAGVQPAGLSVRSTAEHGRHHSGYDSLRDGAESQHGPLSGGGPASGPNRSYGGPSRASSWAPSSHGGPSTRSGGRYGPASTSAGRLSGATFGRVDPHMMSLIRRLAHVDPGFAVDAGSGWDEGIPAGMPPNLIRAHREELRQAAAGGLDHMVIDVIGTLFDQILSDPKVPPQMARQIARLQLPVLRAALGDPSFFSSRKHPVRRFVNRIASLGAAVEDFASDDGKRFLALVKTLVNDIVEGEFDQIDIYENKLAELEQFVADLAQAEVSAQGDPAAVLSEKETELRLGQRYAEVLAGELRGLSGHDFVRDFLTEVWSRVLVQSALKHGADGERFQRLRAVARDLYMSVQPKSSPLQRRDFLAALPRLMQGLNEGMDLIGWPEPARKAFFGQLLPAHAESLKAPQSLSTLDWNLLAKQVDGAFQAPLPKKDELPPPTTTLPVLNDAIPEPRFTPEEAARVGLVDEARVDWNAPVDIDLSAAEPPVAEQDLRIAGLPVPEPAEPVQGRSLVDHVELGYPYQMHVDGAWTKVKLTHVSAGRSFFVFTHGAKHKKTISLTQRMLAKMCDAGRFKTFESAYLIERATARARRQLSSLAAPAAA